MNKKAKKVIVTIVAAVMLFTIPGAIFAQDAAIKNPIGITTVGMLVKAIVTFLTGLVGALTMLALIWGGIMYITALGNDKRVDKAKDVIKWAIIGLSIVLLSYVILNTVVTQLGDNT